MKHNPMFTRTVGSAAAALCLTLGLPIASAKPVPDNLGYGLGALVESNIALKTSAKARKQAELYNGYATQEAAANADDAISSADGRFMVDITLTGEVSFDTLKESLSSNLEVTAVDSKYRGVGIIEGWVAVEDVVALAQVPGVRAIFLARKPRLTGARTLASNEGTKARQIEPLGFETSALTPLGSKFDQGVTQHRVDKICRTYDSSATLNFDGSGITVGVMSDSFNTRGSGSTAATAMATFDLPGAPTNPVNTTPVVVLEDLAAQSDEGRGMAEIVYKMAPKAKIGFATAFTGEVGFANNIRALSGKFPGVPNTRADFVADIITDDVSYGGEPVFSDSGVITNGVDDVAAVGVSYFSSAANSYGVTVYNSDLRWVPNGSGLTAAQGNAALLNTNVNLANVPTNLYQGGFHNFNPDGDLDVACLWNVSNGAAIEMQWDDPYDTTVPVLGTLLYSSSGTTTSAAAVTFNNVPPLSQGQKYIIKETATSPANFDGIVSIIDSNGVTVVDQDTGTDEVVAFFPPVSGTYSIAVRRFGTVNGSFTLTVNEAPGTPLLSTDLNVLAFRVDTGAYVPGASLVSNNYASNRPVELGSVARPTGQTQLQFIIARASLPIGPRASAHVRLGTDANSDPNSAPAEYFDYNSTVTGGHNTAAGCNGVAAYDVFRPNVPQNFTSAGAALVYFDRNNNLKPNAPEVRLQPKFAAANNANTTWLNGDSANDFDTGGGQFGGTSASAPHAAGIAALVLQAHGGTGTVTPTQMTSVLQRSTFTHDLDPYFATGVARATNGAKIIVSIKSDQTAVQSRGRNDPNSHTISLIGPSSLSTFVFNPNGLPTEGGAVTSGRNGLDLTNTYFSIVTPGLYFTNLTATGNFPFTFGKSVGLVASDVSFALSNQAPAPATVTPNQGQTLTLTMAPGSFVGGDVLRFTIGRQLNRGANVSTAGAVAANYNADNFGGGVLIPEGTVIPDGMRFRGTLADGSTFDGFIRNRLGAGFSNLDGFGFLNAEQAVSTPLQ